MVVLIVDSSIHIVESIANLILETGKDRVIHKAFSYIEAVRLFDKTMPTVVLLDESLPDNKSIDLLKYIKSTKNNTSVICLSSRIDNNIEAQCKLLGTDFFLDKYNEFEMIPMIIKAFEWSDNKMANGL